MGFFRSNIKGASGGAMDFFTSNLTVAVSSSSITKLRDSKNAEYAFANNVSDYQIVIGQNVNQCAHLCYNCKNLNSPVGTWEDIHQIPNTATSTYEMFRGCPKFNQPVKLPNNVIDTVYMFHGCNNFNQPITIPNSTDNCRGMFYGCYSFNQPITIPANVKNSAVMFENCNSFNSIITFEESTVNLDLNYMLNNCRSYNKPIIIPHRANWFFRMLGDTRYNSDIYIKGNTTGRNFWGMIYPKSTGYRVNIHCQDLSGLLGTTQSTSITYSSITWTAMTNGYYNSYYNVYLYNNYNG